MDSAKAVTASTFRLDVKAADLVRTFSECGINAVLLKGRSFAELFYRHSYPRPYDDVDLLINPEDLGSVREILGAQGFAAPGSGSLSAETGVEIGTATGVLGDVHGETWVRESDGLAVDIHDGLPEATVPKDQIWTLLSQHRAEVDVAGQPVMTLDAVASALLAALHAGHHGPGGGRPLADLNRAVRILDIELWRQAHALAGEMGAELAFGAGLGLFVAGRELAAELGVTTEPSPALKVIWQGAPWSSSFLRSLAGLSCWEERVALLRHVIAPTPETMRRGSGLARRGCRGLAAAYLYRVGRLLLRLPRAVFGLAKVTLTRS